MERAITLPFSVDESGSINSSNDQKKIWQSRVIAAVMTALGERVFRPRYGGTIKSAVFENENEAADRIRESTALVFASFLPKLSLTEVKISMDVELGILNVIIYYKLPSGEQDAVTVKTATLTRSGDITQEY
jgi:phage baseplate assembly protein W